MKNGLLFLFVALVCRPAQAATDTAAAFLKIEPDAYSAGSGGQGATLGRGAAGLACNPASAAWRRRGREMDVALAHLEWGAGIREESVAWTGAFGSKRAFGVEARVVNYGDLDRRDSDGVGEGSFGARSVAVGAVFARPFFTGLAAGVAGRFLWEQIDVHSGATFAADLGLQGDYPKHGIRFGAAARNLGLAYSLAPGAPAKGVPIQLAAGASVRIMPDPELWLAGEFNEQPVEHRLATSLGAEWTRALGREFVLRLRVGGQAGSRVATMPSAGFTLDASFGALDYAFLYRPGFSSAHRAAITVLFGANPAASAPPPIRPAGSPSKKTGR